jgi:hypothetical protein
MFGSGPERANESLWAHVSCWFGENCIFPSLVFAVYASRRCHAICSDIISFLFSPAKCIGHGQFSRYLISGTREGSGILAMAIPGSGFGRFQEGRKVSLRVSRALTSPIRKPVFLSLLSENNIHWARWEFYLKTPAALFNGAIVSRLADRSRFSENYAVCKGGILFRRPFAFVFIPFACRGVIWNAEIHNLCN